MKSLKKGILKNKSQTVRKTSYFYDVILDFILSYSPICL